MTGPVLALSRTVWRVALVGVLVAGCRDQRPEAEAAVERADRMVEALRDRAAKIVPDRAQGLVDSLAAGKQRLAAGEYAAATQTARQVAVDAIEIANSLASMSTKLTSDFMAFSAELPGRVERIERRVRQLSGRPLPAGVDPAGFEQLASELPAWREAWKAAVKDFEAGELGPASAKATELQVKVAKADSLLGLSSTS